MGITETAMFVGDTEDVRVRVRLLLPDSAKRPSVVVEISIGEHPEGGDTVCLYLRNIGMAYRMGETLLKALNEGGEEYAHLLRVCREREVEE
jgi:hypothetical protein